MRAAIFGLQLLAAVSLAKSSEVPIIGSDCDGSRAWRPVLFIHGSELDSRSWDRMRSEFLTAGFGAEFLVAPNLIPNDGDNIRAARQTIAVAARALLGMREVTRGCAHPQKLDIVAHSMGAMSGRWYAAKLAPGTVHTFVAIAGANHGTDVMCGRPGTGNRQLCPAFARNESDSLLQVRLNGTPDSPLDETPHGPGQDETGVPRVPPDEERHIRWYSIFIEPDEWIVPAESALLHGAGVAADDVLRGLPFSEVSPGNFRLLGKTRHDDLPQDRDVIRLVLRLLADDAGS